MSILFLDVITMDKYVVKQPKNKPSMASIDTAIKRIHNLNHDRLDSE